VARRRPFSSESYEPTARRATANGASIRSKTVAACRERGLNILAQPGKMMLVPFKSS